MYVKENHGIDEVSHQ